ncbi:unnamed protein product [Prunus armeniaca]|uniref:Uncharacterized protein n=1 Tax=Prunus armeniaca TaxID=36596 RepID=A0A6J5V910_PRUAR|nr:unnamed protein product [Prunus armeniaca]CAB4316038.1 unnamed protein product [Prunus armeniaca]
MALQYALLPEYDKKAGRHLISKHRVSVNLDAQQQCDCFENTTARRLVNSTGPNENAPLMAHGRSACAADACLGA